MGALLGEPSLRGVQALWFDAARAHAPNFSAHHQPALLKQLQMLNDRGKRSFQRLGQFAHARRPMRKALNDRPPRRIGERGEHDI
jgi:hypothetical protein